MATLERPTNLETRQPETAAPQRSPWLAWLSVLLLILALGGAFLAGRATAPESPSQEIAPQTVLPSGVAGPMTTQILDDFAAAVNAGDQVRIAGLLTEDATLIQSANPTTLRGNEEIAERMVAWHENGLRLTDPGSPVQNGSFVARSYDIPFSLGIWGGDSMLVFELKGGKLQTIWGGGS